MQMRKIYCFRSFALDSAHVKFDVWNGPKSPSSKQIFTHSGHNLHSCFFFLHVQFIFWASWWVLSSLWSKTTWFLLNVSTETHVERLRLTSMRKLKTHCGGNFRTAKRTWREGTPNFELKSTTRPLNTSTRPPILHITFPTKKSVFRKSLLFIQGMKA